MKAPTCRIRREYQAFPNVREREMRRKKMRIITKKNDDEIKGEIKNGISENPKLNNWVTMDHFSR